jgi:hypothetical protein
MLRITTEENGSRTTLRLQGKLKGEWVWRAGAMLDIHQECPTRGGVFR